MDAASKRRWRAQKSALLPKKQCACGCGTLIPILTLDNKPATYASGHMLPKFPKGNRPWNQISDQRMTDAEKQRRAIVKRKAAIASMPPRLCECGCGESIPALTVQKLAFRYKNGHWPSTGRFRKGHKTWNKGRPHVTSRVGQYTYSLVGYREDLGELFRSRWEANYARYLRATGHTYVYEPACFAITMPDGRQHAYWPDFLVDGREFVEVKGWTTRAPDTMARLEAASNQLPHPLKIVARAEYDLIENEHGTSIPSWEFRNSKLHKPQDKACECCGITFEPKFRKQRFCTDACGGRATSKLTSEAIATVLKRIAEGATRRAVAKEVGVAHSTINRVVKDCHHAAP